MSLLQLPPLLLTAAAAGLLALFSIHVGPITEAVAADPSVQQSATRPATNAAAADNAELKALFAADQGARTGQIGHDLAETDAQRRARVREIMAAGGMRTAVDHFHAAMVFQHGDNPDDYKLAHDLAKKAGEIDPAHRGAKWLSAAAMDRYLLAVGKPQIYGTQFMVRQDVWVLQNIDESAVTDEQRHALGVPPLAEAKEKVRRNNAQRKLADEDNRQIDALFVELVTEQTLGATQSAQTITPRIREIAAEARRLVEAGEAKTVRDLYESAAMIEAAMEPASASVEDWRQVLSLIERARELAPGDERLNIPYARAVDRVRVAEGKGQWYGTFAVRPEQSRSGRWEAPTIDPDSPVSDAQRTAMHIPSAAEWTKMVEQMNRQLDEQKSATRPATRP